MEETYRNLIVDTGKKTQSEVRAEIRARKIAEAMAGK